jgi:hypothetical protein
LTEDSVMTALTPPGAGTAAPPAMAGHCKPLIPGQPASAPRLDRSHLATGISRRCRQLADLDVAMAACWEAAARGAARGIRVDDRVTRDLAMWQRYLDAAARLEPDYSPLMRRLLQEIDRLQRLLDLPLAALRRAGPAMVNPQAQATGCGTRKIVTWTANHRMISREHSELAPAFVTEMGNEMAKGEGVEARLAPCRRRALGIRAV